MPHHERSLSLPLFQGVQVASIAGLLALAGCGGGWPEEDGLLTAESARADAGASANAAENGDASVDASPDAGGNADSSPTDGGLGAEADAGAVPAVLCGNRVVEAGEACDDGNTMDSDGCSATCRIDTNWLCPPLGGACSEREADCSSQMLASERLMSGEVRCSPSGVHRFGLSDAGDLTFWKYGEAMWHADTRGSVRTAMQGDGNLVVYEGDSPLWASGTDGHAGASLHVQDEGRVEIRLDSAVLWCIDCSGYPDSECAACTP